MLTQEHVQTAHEFLEDADREFAAGDTLQGSEKMWGAASHAIIAVAQARGWQFGTHRVMINAARRVANEQDDDGLRAGLIAGQHFHSNFYHGHIEDEDIEPTAELVRYFVARMLDLAS